MRKTNTFLLALLIIPYNLFAQQISINTSPKIDQGTVGFYHGSYALVVGISRHIHWPNAPLAVKNAVKIKSELQRHKFKVKLLENPTTEQLKSAIKDFITKYGENPKNRLLFYYAGYGYTSQQDNNFKMGYIVAMDAQLPDLNMPGFLETAISMKTFDKYAQAIKSNHVLFIFDSCFSESDFAADTVAQTVYVRNIMKPVRQFIVAGGAGEEMPDKNIFTILLLRALKGDGDSNGDGYMTGTELGSFLQNKVAFHSKDNLHPQICTIRNPELNKGDFVFVVSEEIRNSNLLRRRQYLAAKIFQKIGNASAIFRCKTLKMSENDVIDMLKAKDFFERKNNKNGNGFAHDYELRIITGDSVVVDHAAGLMWQFSGASKYIVYKKALAWIKKLNRRGFAGYKDWRLPTLEEALSLLEDEKKNGDLYIDPLFNKKHRYIWTSDLEKGISRAWAVHFYYGQCYSTRFYCASYVRAVRSAGISWE